MNSDAKSPSAISYSAYVGIGSNLGSPNKNANAACELIDQHKAITIAAQSPWYGSHAVGPGEQPDYVNGAIHVRTTLSAEQMLQALQSIEHALGRVRDIRWGPRTLDLDLLWYNGEFISSPHLTVPHPRIYQRNFVLLPLIDIAPELDIPGQGHVRDLAKVLGVDGIWRL